MSQGARISMGEQLQNHLITITRIADIFRDKNLTSELPKQVHIFSRNGQQ